MDNNMYCNLKLNCPVVSIIPDSKRLSSLIPAGAHTEATDLCCSLTLMSLSLKSISMSLGEDSKRNKIK